MSYPEREVHSYIIQVEARVNKYHGGFNIYICELNKLILNAPQVGVKWKIQTLNKYMSMNHYIEIWDNVCCKQENVRISRLATWIRRHLKNDNHQHQSDLVRQVTLKHKLSCPYRTVRSLLASNIRIQAHLRNWHDFLAALIIGVPITCTCANILCDTCECVQIEITWLPWQVSKQHTWSYHPYLWNTRQTQGG